MIVMGCLGQAGSREQEAGNAAMLQAKHQHLQQQPLLGVAPFSQEDKSGLKAAQQLGMSAEGTVCTSVNGRSKPE